MTEIVRCEKVCHPKNCYDGIECLRQQLRGGDEILKWTIEQFSHQYDYTAYQKLVKPVLYCLPMMILPLLFAYFDLGSDIQLSIDYYNKGFFNSTINSTVNTTISSTSLLKPRDYQAAFIMNIICILLPYIVVYRMCVKELALEQPFELPLMWLKGKLDLKWLPHKIHPSIVLIVALPLTPLYFMYIISMRAISAFRHMKSEDKNEQRAALHRWEYQWGMARAAEAGLESSLQLILQLWLLSFHLCEFESNNYKEISFGFIVGNAIDGILSFATAGAIQAGDYQKNLGKILVSFITLSYTISSSYKTMKRGSVSCGDLCFILVSNFLLVLARCLSLCLYFTAVHSFTTAILLPLFTHYVLTLVIKFSLEPSIKVKGSFRYFATLVSILASSIVNISSIKPLKTHEEMDKKSLLQSNEESTSLKNMTDQNGHVHNGDAAQPANGHPINPATQREEEHVFEITTGTGGGDSFKYRTAFFALQFAENIILCVFAFTSEKEDPILGCLGGAVVAIIVAVIILSPISWLGYAIYYGCWGHPWSDINGPECFVKMKRGGIGKYSQCNTEDDGK